MNITQMYVTPDMAKEWLKRNANNRPLKMNRIDAYVRDMKAGKWLLTHQGIAFDDAGNILDGQHRLTAVALSGVPCMMTVCTNMPREYMIAVDNGTPRSASDAFTISGLYADGNNDFRQKGCIGILNSIVELGYKRIKLTNSERIKLIEKFGDYVLAVWRASKTGSALSAPIRAACLAAILNGENVEDVQNFIRVFSAGEADGCYGMNIAAALNLSRYVLRAKANRMTISKDRLYMLTQHTIYHFIRGEKQNVANGVGKMTKFKYPVYEIIKDVLEG